jgi:hypothetical protein
MAAMTVLLSLVLVIGCGEGPKHLPKSDYQHGKAAFEMLEQFEKASSGSLPRIEESGSFLLAAAQQMDAMGTRSSSSGLRIALTNYEDSINASGDAKYELASAEIAVKLAQATGGSLSSLSTLTEKQYAAHRAIYEIEPIIKLCRDDAAQYFDATAASTNTCNAALTEFRAKHKTS